MTKKNVETQKRRMPGRAVADEDPDHSPMDEPMPTEPAQPYDVERLEEDRAKSKGAARKPARP